MHGIAARHAGSPCAARPLPPVGRRRLRPRAARRAQPAVVATRHDPEEPECSTSSDHRHADHDAAYYAISCVLVRLPLALSSLVFGPRRAALAWVLSIVGLRSSSASALIPLFVKQIKSSRNMQLIQPR